MRNLSKEPLSHGAAVPLSIDKAGSMSETIDTLLTEYKSGLKALYRDRLRGLYLYGSYARGKEESDSDLDLLIVLDVLSSYGAEINRTSELTSEMSLKYGISV